MKKGKVRGGGEEDPVAQRTAGGVRAVRAELQAVVVQGADGIAELGVVALQAQPAQALGALVPAGEPAESPPAASPDERGQPLEHPGRAGSGEKLEIRALAEVGECVDRVPPPAVLDGEAPVAEVIDRRAQVLHLVQDIPQVRGRHGRAAAERLRGPS